ncbi:MAG TPA: hypothetical protein DEF42_15860 [Desulfosporosinus sp.]|nr:hypothetical protein [Desulfosporosinus sp.]
MENEKKVAIYHVVRRNENFEETANSIFQMVKDTERNFPSKQRVLYLDIEEHRNSPGGFDSDMLELQKDFIVGFLLPYLSEVNMPLGSVKNPDQNNDIPDELQINETT